MNPTYTLYRWLNKSKNSEITSKSIIFEVSPKTDFWQIFHYGFSRVDGNCLMDQINCDISFKVKVYMNYIAEFDQAGVIVYYDEDNWAKMSV